MKNIILIKSRGLLSEGLLRLLEASGEFQMIAHYEDLDSFAESRHNVRSPINIIISSRILNTVSRCEQYVEILGKKDSPITGCSIRTMILIKEQHEVMIDMYHAQGFKGFLFEKVSFTEFEQALRAQFEGAVYLPSYVAEERIYRAGPRRFPMVPLNEREQEVLRLLSLGKTSREIGSKLNLSEASIINCRKKLQSRLDVHSIAGLTMYALRMGLATL